MALHSFFPACINGKAPGPDYSSWFGTGEDGDLTVSTDVALPVALDSGQIIKQYNNLTITSTGVLHPANRCNGMILLVKGDLTVDGTIHVDKCAPLLNDNEELAAQEQHIVLCGVTAGGKGGDSGKGYVDWSGDLQNSGAPRTGGNGFAFGGGMGAGSDGVYYGGVGTQGGPGDPRPPAGTSIPYLPDDSKPAKYGAGGNASGTYLRGGGGPGGSGAIMYGTGTGYAGNNGDAIGGGALWIFAMGRVRINASGKISAKGGNGAAGVASPSNSNNVIISGGGGAGGGGIVCVVHAGDCINSGSVTADGGTGGGSASVNDETSAPGSNGSSGTVLITNIADLLGEGGDGYEWATISTVSGGAGTSATGVYCVTSEDGHPIAVELSGQQQIPVLVGSYLRDNYSWVINENVSDVEAVGSKLYLVKGDVSLAFMGPS